MSSTRPTPAEVLEFLHGVFAESLPDQARPAANTPLFGPDARLDSMELVNFVADVEDAAEDRFGADVVLADERALSRSKSPFRNLAALAEYLGELLEDE